MFVASDLNSDNLFQRLGGFQASILPGSVDLEHFLFRLSSAARNLRRIRTSSDACLTVFRKHKDRLTIKDDTIAFWSPEVVDFVNEFSPFLSNLRTAQNLFLHVLPRPDKATIIPNSLADAVKKIGSYGFAQEVCQIIKTYWTAHGQRLKDYRDIDQHFYLMADSAFIQTHPQERLIIYLPDDPSIKSRSRKSGRGSVDAATFFWDSFRRFSDVVDDVFEFLGYLPTKINQITSTTHRGLDTSGAYKTVGLTSIPGFGVTEIGAGSGNIVFCPPGQESRSKNSS